MNYIRYPNYSTLLYSKYSRIVFCVSRCDLVIIELKIIVYEIWPFQISWRLLTSHNQDQYSSITEVKCEWCWNSNDSLKVLFPPRTIAIVDDLPHTKRSRIAIDRGENTARPLEWEPRWLESVFWCLSITEHIKIHKSSCSSNL